MNWNDILERAGWTFVQAFVGTFGAISLISDLSEIAGAADAAAAAGLSAVLSFVKTVAQERLAIPETRVPPGA